MILRLLGSVLTILLGGIVTAALLLFSNLDRAFVLDGYLVLVGVVVLQALARATGAATRAAGPTAFDRAIRRRRDVVTRPERLLRLEGQVFLATTIASDFHHGIRPLLREAAAHRLRTRLGVELDGEPARAARALGPEAWELLRPDRERPADRFGPGVPAHALSRVIDSIEGIPS